MRDLMYYVQNIYNTLFLKRNWVGNKTFNLK